MNHFLEENWRSGSALIVSTLVFRILLLTQEASISLGRRVVCIASHFFYCVLSIQKMEALPNHQWKRMTWNIRLEALRYLCDMYFYDR